MAGEGVFPKSAGDIAYASEANSFHGFGDGSDGAYADSGNLTQGTVYQYSTFSLTNGNTLTTASTSGKPIIIYVQGDCTIAGTIDLDGKGYDAGTGGAQGGSDTNGDPGTAGEDYQRNGSYGTAASGGTGGQLGATAAGGGKSTTSLTAWQIFDADYNQIHIDSGTGGAGGGGGRSGSSPGSDGAGGNGGAGGGSIIFVVGGDFTFSATGVITLDGVNGSDGGDATGSTGSGGGGGGGAGGNLWIMYRGTLTNSGTITTTSGSGGTGGDANGAGYGAGGGGGGGSNVTQDGSNGALGNYGGGANTGGNGGAGRAGTSSLQQVLFAPPIIVQGNTI